MTHDDQRPIAAAATENTSATNDDLHKTVTLPVLNATIIDEQLKRQFRELAHIKKRAAGTPYQHGKILSCVADMQISGQAILDIAPLTNELAQFCLAETQNQLNWLLQQKRRTQALTVSTVEAELVAVSLRFREPQSTTLRYIVGFDVT